MSLLSRLFATRDASAPVRGLWDAVVARARDPYWYADAGLADCVEGRFDAVTMVLAMVLLRMEASPPLARHTARLTELFVTDMDGQLRESGVGDLVVGKRIGKLMGALGGRLGTYRAALAHGADPALLVEAVRRNMTMVAGADPAPLAQAVRALATHLAAADDAALLAGALA